MSEKELAPIIIFAFIRLEALKKVVESLQNNFLAEESELFIYIDGPRNKDDQKKTEAVYSFCKSISGFKHKTITYNENNLGLDPSVIKGVTEVINKFGKAIVIEDDIITTKNFLSFMNQALDFYKEESKVMSISGFGLKIKKTSGYPHDVYAYNRSSSWGWATWKDRWNSVDWMLSDWEDFAKNKKMIKEFNKGGSDLFKMLKSCKNGGNMWDIRFAYTQYKQKRVTLFPFDSKVDNIGFGDEFSTHCHQKFSRFKISKDETLKTKFQFPKQIRLNKQIQKRVYWYYSIPMRAYSLIRRKLDI